ncbi:MAG: hypothetical protein PHO32_09210 [Candidatus Cloacimonetes bacterium]|nr:hypothetical protein [Candidatus Cloacimonadota bacterium]
MQKQSKESLGIAKIFALIEANGEVCAAVKRKKLGRTTLSIKDARSGYLRCSRFIDLIRINRGAQDRLSMMFGHFPVLAIRHLTEADCFLLHELFEVKAFLWHYLQLRNQLIDLDLADLHPLPDLQGLFNTLDPEHNGLPTFQLSGLYSSRLSSLISKRQEISHKLKETRYRDLEKAKSSLEMPTLKEEFVIARSKQNEISRLQDSGSFLVSNQNLANYTFRLADSPLAMQLKQDLHAIAEAITEEEAVVLEELSRQIKSNLKQLEQAYNSIEEISWDFCLAEFAQKYGCCIPRLSDAEDGIFCGLSLVGAVNLPLKIALQDKQRCFQPLDICLKQTGNLITGPNMGGKSTVLTTLGQMCYLATFGIPLPAREAELPIFEVIYYNHDSGENSDTLSSFGREVVSLVTALGKKGSKLFLLDEFAKGTNPAEGESICLATLNYLYSKGIPFVAATHFSAPAKLHNLAHFSIKGVDDAIFKTLENMDDTSLETRLKLLSEAMDYALMVVEGTMLPPQCAVKIASLLGLPAEITRQITEGIPQ